MNLIKRAQASIRARYIQLSTLKNYKKTPVGKCQVHYNGQSIGRMCFLIGNGISLRAENLTFAFNRGHNIFDQTR